MTSTAAAPADGTPPPVSSSDIHEITKDSSDVENSNHDLPARTMREDQDEQTPPQNEDPATVAASEELKHTSISDKIAYKPSASPDKEHEPSGDENTEMILNAKVRTPEAHYADAQDEEMKDRYSSPKKKRGRDQDEDTKGPEDENDDPTSSADGSVVNGSRTTRSEPEKKRRPRDTSEDFTKAAEKGADTKADSSDSTKSSPEGGKEKRLSSPRISSPRLSKGKPQTSATAFASSGFASLAAASTSPFGVLGASKPSVFGTSALKSTSGFGALAGANSSSSTSTTTSAFGSSTGGFGALGGKSAAGFSFGGGSSSGFGGLASSSIFGSKLGNGFAGGAGPKLSSFAAPGKENIAQETKPAKAFGAPESDGENGESDDGGSEGGAGTDDEESAPVAVEERKRTKTSKVHIDDGEAGEATLLQMRAKLFTCESKEVGWKERGVGTLKINVHKGCATYDSLGTPIPGSFDASGIEDEESGAVLARLIMRQENTHRVILNTVILSATEFLEKPSTSAVQLLFTAFEGETEPKPINMLLRMSEANARLFRAEIDSIQRELSS